MTNNIKVIGTCPDCNGEIRFRKAAHLGQLVTCPNCETSLEVVRRNPLELDWAFEDPIDEDEYDEWDDEDEEDDWDDDYDDWDDDYDDWDDED